MKVFGLVAAICIACIAFGAAEAPVEAEVEADGSTVEPQQAPKPRQTLISLDEESFLESINSHELSIVVFYTKHAPQWPLVNAIVEVTAANYSATRPDRDINWVSVPLDENPRLSTYSHFNMIDVMFMFPKYALFPIRLQQNLSVTALLEETDNMWPYSTVGLTNWDNIDDIKNQWTDSHLKEEGSKDVARDCVDVFGRRMAAYTDMLKLLLEDESKLAFEANSAKNTMLRWDSKSEDVNIFLGAKEKVFMLEQFLQYAFDKEQVKARRRKQAGGPGSRKKTERAKTKTPPAPAEEELF